MKDSDDIQAWLRGLQTLTPQDQVQAWSSLSDQEKRAVLDDVARYTPTSHMAKAWRDLYWNDHKAEAYRLLFAAALVLGLVILLILVWT